MSYVYKASYTADSMARAVAAVRRKTRKAAATGAIYAKKRIY